MLAGIMGFLAALPEMVGLFREMVAGIKSISAELKRQNQNAWIDANRQLIFDIKKATTDSQRWVLLRKLVAQSEDFPT